MSLTYRKFSKDTMRIVLLAFLTASLLYAQKPVLTDDAAPTVLTFVAPAYPRIAKDNRMMGTTVTDITVSADGQVSDAKVASAHPAFANYVLSALRQWKFRPSQAEAHLKITVRFELLDDCSDGTDKHPLTSETYVSADLPTMVYVRTAARCMETSNSQVNH